MRNTVPFADPCGTRRPGWERPGPGSHRLPCIVAQGHAGAHHDVFGRTWEPERTATLMRADAPLMRADAPQVRVLWRLADRTRATADRTDDVAAGSLLIRLRIDRRIMRLADKVRAVADHFDNLAFDVSPERRRGW
ncbi:hypothetical protein ACFVAF_39340 [Streptomyces sp. NPDC057596]|uniref:hypothetical protein n=1 Tax=unclassified Streptomyces TaxID=2593676 RepID=UPI0034127DBF